LGIGLQAVWALRLILPPPRHQRQVQYYQAMRRKREPAAPRADAVAPVRSKDELRKLLFIQASIAQQASREMLAIASNPRLSGTPELYVAAQKRLLEKYAGYPTLTEFAQDPQLTNVYKWGATFGVASLAGLLVVEEVRHLQPHFAAVARQLYFLLLKELDQPQHKYLVEALGKALKLPAKSARSTNGLLARLVEAYAVVSIQFGLMSAAPGLSLTPTGKRVLLHLADAQRFVEETAQAHAKVRPAE
jgi:hypothetical protein